jgi:hypothetical protein
LAVCVNVNRVATALVHVIYSGNEGGGLVRLVADVDGAGLSGDTSVADIDVVVAGG